MKSYGIKTKAGNVASVTFTKNKKPTKKVLLALEKMIDLASLKCKK